MKKLVRSWSVFGGDILAHFYGSLATDGAVLVGTVLEGAAPVALSFAVPTAVQIDAELGNLFTLNLTSNAAYTILAPLNPPAAGRSQLLVLTIRNVSGGAAGAATFNAIFKLATWTNPANNTSRTITFKWDGTNWVEVSRTTVDVPN